MNYLDGNFRVSDERTRALCATDPRKAALRRALLKAEAVRNRSGWNQPPLFGVIENTDNIMTLAVWDDVTDAMRADGDPANCVRALAAEPERTARLMLSARSFPGFYGMFFLCEGWQLTVPKDAPAEQQEDARTAITEHRINEHPDRVETRKLFTSGIDGLLWTILRQRGRKPLAICEEALEETELFDGGILTSLYKITFAVHDLIRTTRESTC